MLLGDSHVGRFSKPGHEAQKLWKQSELCGENSLVAGIGGDTTHNVLWRLHNGLLNNLEHRKDVVFAVVVGGNNVPYEESTPTEIIKAQKLIKDLLVPYGKAFFFQPMCKQKLITDIKWHAYAKEIESEWDSTDLSITWEKEMFCDDQIHLNERGYIELLRVLNEKVNEYI